MSTQHTAFDVFLSYSRDDNLPVHAGEPGSVIALRDHIVEDHRRFSTEPLQIFLDVGEIEDMQDWRYRILRALRSSKILLVCLSPNYFRSDYCRWEWEEYVRRQVHQAMGSDSIASVYFVELPESDTRPNVAWRESVYRGNYTDIRPWFPEGARAFRHDEVRRRMAKLGESLWTRIRNARRADGVPSNVQYQNAHFVGRTGELRQVHEQLECGSVGVVTAVHGLGGQGKTELAVSYAHAWADSYPAGLWVIGAEGKQELLPLIGELAFAPEFAYMPTEAERADQALLGRAVLAELQRRAAARREADPDGAAAALILLDNVSHATLLSPEQLSPIARADWLRILATSRLGPTQFGEGEGIHKRRTRDLSFIEVGSLPEADAIALVCAHQPGQQFADPSDEAVVTEIVRALGGFTLAVEQVAVYLGLYQSVKPSSVLDRLRATGLTITDTLVDGLTADGHGGFMRHQQKQLGVILESTLAMLDSQAQTTLRFAALLPADGVPLPWLRELVAMISRKPPSPSPAQDEPDSWVETCRRLEGMRLLTPGHHGALGRIHRLVAAHVAAQDPDRAHRQELLSDFITQRATQVATASAPSPWEIEALCAVLPPAIATSPSRQLAVSASSLSMKARTYLSLAAAASLLESTVPAFRRLAEATPSNSELLRDVAVSLGFMGSVAKTQGRLGDARRLIEESLNIAKRLAEATPWIPERQRDVSVSLNKLGELAMAQGDLVAAQRCFDESLVLARSLAKDERGNIVGWRDLGASLNQQGDLAMARGAVTDARRLFSESYEIARRLLSMDPANPKLARDLAASCARLGEVQFDLGQLAEAGHMFAHGHQITRALATADPTNLELQRDMAATTDRLASLAIANGNPDEAHRFGAETLQISRRLADADPTNTERHRNVSLSLNKLVTVALATGALGEAQSAAKESLLIAKRLFDEGPKSQERQSDLAESLGVLARVATAYEKFDTAQTLYDEQLKLVQGLANADPANVAHQRDLALAHYNLGYVAMALTDMDLLRSHLRRSFEILTALRQRDGGMNAETAKAYELVAPIVTDPEF